MLWTNRRKNAHAKSIPTNYVSPSEIFLTRVLLSEFLLLKLVLDQEIINIA